MPKVTEPKARGKHDCYQDHCENAPFASVGGLEKRGKLEAPDYIDGADQLPYLDGYIEQAVTMYGEDWQTCEFGWQKALTIEGEALSTETPIQAVSRLLTVLKHRKCIRDYRIDGSRVFIESVQPAEVVKVEFALIDPADDTAEPSDAPRCSICRKKMPTKTDKQKMRVGPDVCLCEHNWLQHTKYVPPEVVDE